MSVESLSETMESGVVEGMGSPISIQRTELIRDAASPLPFDEIELGSIKTDVSQAIENLNKETEEMFPSKENIADVTIESKKDLDGLKIEKKSEKKELKTPRQYRQRSG